LRPIYYLSRIKAMTQNIEKLFKKLENIEPSRELEGNILKSIALEKSWQAKKGLIFADTLTLGSLGAFVFVIVNFWNGIAESEFWSLLKLIFSDTSAVASFWKDFAFSLLETFPAAHLAAILAPVFLLLVAMKIYFRSNEIKYYKHIS